MSSVSLSDVCSLLQNRIFFQGEETLRTSWGMREWELVNLCKTSNLCKTNLTNLVSARLTNNGMASQKWDTHQDQLNRLNQSDLSIKFNLCAVFPLAFRRYMVFFTLGSPLKVLSTFHTLTQCKKHPVFLFKSLRNSNCCEDLFAWSFTSWI